jgi:hypothetical protein
MAEFGGNDKGATFAEFGGFHTESLRFRISEILHD